MTDVVVDKADLPHTLGTCGCASQVPVGQHTPIYPVEHVEALQRLQDAEQSERLGALLTAARRTAMNEAAAFVEGLPLTYFHEQDDRDQIVRRIRALVPALVPDPELRVLRAPDLRHAVEACTCSSVDDPQHVEALERLRTLAT